MKKLILAGLALSLFSGAALAQPAPRGDWNNNGNTRHDDRDRNDRNDWGRNDRNDRDDRRFGRNDNRFENRNWRRGQHFRPHGHYVVVRDYGHYRLHRPPHGYHWVRYGNDFVLISISNGFIRDFFQNRY